MVDNSLQVGELFSERHGDGVFRAEITMLPMLTITLMQVDCRSLNDGIGKPDACRRASLKQAESHTRPVKRSKGR